MFNALELGFFKAFRSKQRMPLAPITLLFGPNSAGKSSVIHSLALINEAERSGTLDVYHTRIGGSSIDLGGFRQYVFGRNAASRVQWGIDLPSHSFEGASEILQQSMLIGLQTTIGIPVDDLGFPIHTQLVSLDSCEISADGAPLLRMSRRFDSGLRLDFLNVDHALVQSFLKDLIARAIENTDLVSEDVLSQVISRIDDIIGDFDVRPGAFLPKGVWSNPESESTTILSLIPNWSHVSSAIYLGLLETIDGIIAGVHTSTTGIISNLSYLGPFRTYPSRRFLFEDEHSEDWFAGGSFAWNIVRTDAAIRSSVNTWLSAEWLQTPYEIRTQRLVSPSQARPQVLGAIQAFVNQVEEETDGEPDFSLIDFEQLANRIVDETLLNPQQTEGLDELILVDRRTETIVSHRDVGIGVSQILPVLVTALAYRERLIMIEQPEIHLHPALQSELADVFIRSALGDNKNSFLLETHSEHLMLRLLRRVRETAEGTLPPEQHPIKPEDISVLYIMPGSSGSTVRHIPVTLEGEFGAPWPQGFFAERAKELF